MNFITRYLLIIMNNSLVISIQLTEFLIIRDGLRKIICLTSFLDPTDTFYVKKRVHNFYFLDDVAYFNAVQKKVMPEITPLCPESGSGVLMSPIESVKLHFQRLIILLHLQPGRYSMTAKEGLDGSGRHAVYDQLGNVQTHNIIIWMWVPLQLSKNSDQHLHACTSKSTESEIVWKEGAPSSPEAAQPIFITMGKEDKKLLEQIVPPVHEEITRLHSSGAIVEVSGEVFNFEVEFIRSMNDGKMQKLLLGRGAFCL